MRRIKKLVSALSVFCFVAFFPQSADFSSRPAEENIKYDLVHRWVDKLGLELWHLGDFITRRKEVQESFKEAEVVSRVGAKIVEDMANDIKVMMDLKISAVRRIMDTAENTAMSHQNEEVDKYFEYYNSKDMIEPGETPPTEPPRDLEEMGVPRIVLPPKEIVLTPNAQFFNIPVNTSVSSVHVPTNVFDRANEVIKAIKWSENLDRIFRDNYRKDPTLSFQFFGSSTGFMRQFPASKWSYDPVDLYDCRLRSWYIEAATSPKDVIILVDSSGSMTGQRKDIAKHVVGTILDTLGTNDFVNIFTFAEEIEPVVPCFNNMLVQATLGNIRQFKLSLESLNTQSIANFSAALTRAFEILEDYRNESTGASCNQAIMLISDGAPYNYRDIFEQFNWRNLPYMPVRVFTYLIGKEVADVKEIKWMACANQGYYVHLSDLAEVREQVLNYIPVMARPLVLGRHDHPVIWSQVYADVIDPKMTDWLWEVKECEEQKDRFLSARRNKLYFSDAERERREMRKLYRNLQQSKESPKYNFVTTVSIPIYDRRENATRIANLLGVAGTDIPIKEIKKMMTPHMLGVNGYAFIVTNNGYILVHPDLRPIFQDILKPAYNSIDMMEVELLDDDRSPRDFNTNLVMIRDSIIKQESGNTWMITKSHYDDMRRVVAKLKRLYYWTPILNTPFTLVITFPEQYGLNRLQIRSDNEIHRIHIKGGNVSSYFSGHWKIHPDWLYCKDSNRSFSSPEAELLHFLERMKAPGWKWPLNRTPPPPEHTVFSNSSSGRVSSKPDKESYYCDRKLMQALVFDARVTEWFTKNLSHSTKEDKGPSPIAVLMGLWPRSEFKQRFGITVTFLATHSGLTRWQEFYTNKADEMRPEHEFSDNNRRSIDEVWYKRAVEQHFTEPQSFVYSVPFNMGEDLSDILVTASHAIFHTEGGKSAPAAVVGFQFRHSALVTLFKNITNYVHHKVDYGSDFADNCAVESTADCAKTKTCASDSIDCYILDNNGYVIISPKSSDTGKFFGEVRGDIMTRLVQEGVYKDVTIYDYQAICFEPKFNDNSSNRLRSPLKHFLTLVKWFWRQIVWAFVNLQIIPIEAMNMSYIDDEFSDRHPPSKAEVQQFDSRVLIKRTRPQSCDKEMKLYTLDLNENRTVFTTASMGCERPFVIMPIPASNLFLLVVDALCTADPSKVLTTLPKEVDYNQSLPCFKSRNQSFSRKRPLSCINKHVNESSIELCGDASHVLANYLLIAIALGLIHFFKFSL
ncbi:voltage-dependent calcium channel subunit alpha-2/delta-3 isoform X5 [Hermetia illucens]|uniref:voltage-dependent calcium channel subunit alpha-2/delta-3 isoform X5 n=1 Tax=Hermetia illucens TaxID=343691 RepID=UPI0018CC28AF|nr:voltage-dependent calcium channel subunit alpha-2/delta-3 isoform X5 [Hermetia illucens]